MAEAADIEDLVPALVELRRDLHANPELGFAEHRTAAIVADVLRALDLEVHTGIGGTGVVGVLRAGRSGRSVALRADMDALPIQEETGLPYASRRAGVFHGCGHDGHVAMLLGAARHLSRTRRFDGTVYFVFQPAEEGLGGARAMIEAGLFRTFPADQVYALHNWPQLPAGTAMTRPGPIMAAADRFEIEVRGRGGHAAMPHTTPDAILAASELVAQLNTIVSRRIPPTSDAVLSVTRIEGGRSHNVLPAAVRLVGTVRTFDASVQDQIETAVRRIAQGVGIASGTEIDVVYTRYYPATCNHEGAAAEALAVASAVCDHASVATDPAFTAEDFAFMLQACEGAYLWLGQAKGEAVPLHHPRYDFNDEIIPFGIRWHVGIVERRLSACARERSADRASVLPTPLFRSHEAAPQGHPVAQVPVSGARPAPRFVRLERPDRNQVTVEVDGRPVTACAGDSVLIAVLAATGQLRQSEFGDGVRAGFCLMGACQDCWVWTAEGERLRACTTPAADGMRILTRLPTESLWPRPG